jgi:hypothetical protein
MIQSWEAHDSVPAGAGDEPAGVQVIVDLVSNDRE